MKNTAFIQHACLWLFVTAICLGVSLVVISPASAQTAGERDHLKCYQTRDSNPASTKTVGLFNDQFGQEQCELVTKAPLLCAPTIKNNGDDLLGGPIPAQDYLCYKVKCPKRDRTTHRVADQFGNRLVVIGDAQWLCTPAQKSDPLLCGQTAPLCNGECPTGLTCRSLAVGALCQCQ